MKRDFNEWLGHLRNSIASYDYYVDFPKVFTNVDSIKVELNILNSLIGEKNIAEAFKGILQRYPETLKCIPILLAVRKNEILILDDGKDFEFSFKKMNYDIDAYTTFMEKSGLFDLMQHHVISNLIDYAMTIVKTNIPATTLVSLAASILADASKLTFSSQQVPYADSYQFAWYKQMAILSFDIDEAAKRVNEFIYGK